MIHVHAYESWSGAVYVNVAHSPKGVRALNGLPCTKVYQFDEAEAKELLKQLTVALANPIVCDLDETCDED